MMYITDKGTAYSAGFYTLREGRVWNPFTNKSLGFLVRSIPSNNYLLIKPITIWGKIKNWFRIQQDIHDRREIDYNDTEPGSLKETMKWLENNGRK